jgi:N-acetylglucosaminyl-diphospho-decaprenol L-rhamnosyltransferase
VAQDQTGLASVGAVIVHFHREREAAALVGQLVHEQGLSQEHVVVVDNGSTPGLLDFELQATGARPEVVALANPGYAAAANAGRRALGDAVRVVVILSHEVRLHAGCVYLMARHLEAAPRSLVGPVLTIPTQDIWSAGGLLSKVRLLPAHRRSLGAASVVDGALGAEWLDGAVVATTRQLLDELGGLDERYFLYGEDIDLGLRARSVGAEVTVVLAAGATQSPSAEIDPFLWTRNMFLLFRAHRHPLAWLLWLMSCCAGILRDLFRGAPSGDLARRWRGVVAGVKGCSGPPPLA